MTQKSEYSSDRAVYGTIPYFGGSYTVKFDCSGLRVATQTLSGYGDFPFARFNIPVLDFRNLPKEKMITWLNKDTNNPIEALKFAREIGIPIIG